MSRALGTKRRLLLLSVLHACPSTFFLYGEPFYARAKFGWGAGQIGLTQALIGFCITIGAFVGGQVAHRRHPRLSITLGLVGGIVGGLAGLVGTPWAGVPSLLLAIVVLSFSQALVWPGIEASLMADESPDRVQDLVGYFNLTWSLGTAMAFLVATPLMTRLGLRVLFALPVTFYIANLLFLRYALPHSYPAVLADYSPPIRDREPARREGSEAEREAKAIKTQEQRAAYRWLGWLANPFAYLAINVIVTYNPTVQQRLGLSFAAASVWCGLWFFVRMAAFELLRRWTWWHYRPAFLCAYFGIVMLSFAGIVLAPTLLILLIAQVMFGLSAGLLYQSSLFYSMAGSEAQGAHGGFHETFIGLGQMLGPLIAYGGTRLLPTNPAFPIWLVLALMAAGWMALIAVSQGAMRGKKREGKGKRE